MELPSCKRNRNKILPKITDITEPSVYLLKSQEATEGLPRSACLTTDFQSSDNDMKMEVNGEAVNLTEKIMLDQSDNKWRYGVVTWDYNNPSENLNCIAKYKDKQYNSQNPTDEGSQMCSSLSIDDNFKTDERLNSLSLTVLGVRVLVIKGILFNLILTLKLWSF
ncbi:hypothetical protein FKM82_020198 [Ascaphus truei]